MKIFPVFHNSLLLPKQSTDGLPGQKLINEAGSRRLRGRVLERDDDTQETVEQWTFETILDSHNDYGNLQYLVKWEHHRPTWQPATDLKGQDTAILKFHTDNPSKQGLPSWVRWPTLLKPTWLKRSRNKNDKPTGTGVNSQPSGSMTRSGSLIEGN
ncbi:hypothetical protein M011DRAFT_478562 [Sporormia fimetaria CBS 119925]|uniref:Chromo domain-containing protein n=1 Tax=Sporormia fimetaria CBS 119925 TaxID=1340428 RepID=A0A6A6V8Z8_9PLEO|nr:hypothetical protein M011DRAFT_478562 [Sporormia fimetaria CBS 119925]